MSGLALTATGVGGGTASSPSPRARMPAGESPQSRTAPGERHGFVVTISGGGSQARPGGAQPRSGPRTRPPVAQQAPALRPRSQAAARAARAAALTPSPSRASPPRSDRAGHSAGSSRDDEGAAGFPPGQASGDRQRRQRAAGQPFAPSRSAAGSSANRSGEQVSSQAQAPLSSSLLSGIQRRRPPVPVPVTSRSLLGEYVAPVAGGQGAGGEGTDNAGEMPMDGDPGSARTERPGTSLTDILGQDERAVPGAALGEDGASSGFLGATPFAETIAGEAGAGAFAPPVERAPRSPIQFGGTLPSTRHTGSANIDGVLRQGRTPGGTPPNRRSGAVHRQGQSPSQGVGTFESKKEKDDDDDDDGTTDQGVPRTPGNREGDAAAGGASRGDRRSPAGRRTPGGIARRSTPDSGARVRRPGSRLSAPSRARSGAADSDP